jgi:hypothetical protein
MDHKRFCRLAFVTVGTLLIANSGLRAEAARGLKLTQPMIIEGIYLRTGVYDVQWKLGGARVAVTFSRKGRAVAVVQGELVTLDRSAARDTLYFTKHPDGFFYINGLGFGGTRKGIVFPVLKSRAKSLSPNPQDDTLMENEWRNRALVPSQIGRF